MTQLESILRRAVSELEDAGAKCALIGGLAVSVLVPIEPDTSSVNSAFFLAYQAAQVKTGDRGFLSRDITVHDLLLNRSDVRHVYATSGHKWLMGPKGTGLLYIREAIADKVDLIAREDGRSAYSA